MTGQTPPQPLPREESGTDRPGCDPPTLTGKPAGRFEFGLRLAVFVGLLMLWTWKLLEPYPVPESLRDEIAAAGASFFLAKSLHIGGYAFLTVLAGTLPVPRYWRVFLIGLLAWHGAVTEVLQAVLPFNRTGRFADVLIDWAGITLGVVALRFLPGAASQAPG